MSQGSRRREQAQAGYERFHRVWIGLVSPTIMFLAFHLTYTIISSISEESIKQTQLAFRPTGGHLVCILFDLTGLPRTDVKTEATLVYTALGQPHSWGPYNFDSVPEDRALYVKFAKLSTKLFADGSLQVRLSSPVISFYSFNKFVRMTCVIAPGCGDTWHLG